MPIFALVDCNNFYASCEKLFDPTLKDTPVVVLSNNDGCVVARSAEAKVLGIPMGAPWFQIREAAERNRSLSGVLLPPAPTRNNPSHVHEGGAGSDQGDSDQQQVAAA